MEILLTRHGQTARNYYIQNILAECNIECSNTNIEKF